MTVGFILPRSKVSTSSPPAVVYDFALRTPDKDIAKAISDIIGKYHMLPGEDKPPFAYIRLVDNYNGV